MNYFSQTEISLTLRISDVYFPTWCMNFTVLSGIFEPEYCQNLSKNANFINSCVVWKLFDSAQVALTCPVLSVSTRITKKDRKKVYPKIISKNEKPEKNRCIFYKHWHVKIMKHNFHYQKDKVHNKYESSIWNST